MSTVADLEYDPYRDPAAVAALEKVRAAARIRHKTETATAKAKGRDYPLLPWECSWAFEQQFGREWPYNYICYREPTLSHVVVGTRKTRWSPTTFV